MIANMQSLRRSAQHGLLWIASFVVLGFSAEAHAVIVYADPGRLTTAPTGAYANSGWQYEGAWAGFTGTPIAPNYFITAAHIGGSVGETFLLNGVDYTTTAEFNDPNSDLRIWEVSQSFPDYATLDLKKNEVGKKAVIYGRGTSRGSAVTVKNQLRGWEWGSVDYQFSWGENTISAAKNIGENVLEFSFKASKSKPDEGTISEGDSGGGVFVKVGKTWELAGVNYSASGPYSYDSSFADSFNGSLLNPKGLYDFTTADQAMLIKSSQPSTDYATRISTEANWIDSVLDGNATPADAFEDSTNVLPEPGMLALTSLAPTFMLKRHRKAHG